ncbi:hypothetical protein BGZ58_008398, partial [Dissophora ornata]
CHKMIPAAGQGAINAMQDAVVLANCIYDMPDSSAKSIHAAFQDYKDQRYEHAKMQIDISKFFGKILAGQSFFERLLRKIILNYVPYWVQARNLMKTVCYRPQITWLPFAPNHGTGPVLPQKPSWRYQERLARGETTPTPATTVTGAAKVTTAETAEAGEATTTTASATAPATSCVV